MKIAGFALIAVCAVLGLAMADDSLWNNNNNGDWNNDDGARFGFGGISQVSQASFGGYPSGYGGASSYGYGSMGYGQGYGSMGYGQGHGKGYGQATTYVPLIAPAQGGSGLGGGIFSLLLLFILLPMLFNRSNADQIIVLNNTA